MKKALECNLHNQRFETRKFHKAQSKMYKDLILGLSHYSKKELEEMSESEKEGIHMKYLEAQYQLNLWKQELTSRMANNILSCLFPDSQCIKDLVSFPNSDPKYLNTLSFSLLDLSKEHVSKKLIALELLPKNFLHLPNGEKAKKMPRRMRPA